LLRGRGGPWIRLNEIENLADALYRALLAQVFDSGSDVVTMIKIKKQSAPG
jgi:hypothetical protein